jgi:hypothetical protein
MLALTEELSAPALPAIQIDQLQALINAPPEEFRQACASMFRRLAVEGFREIRAPRNYKELATVVDLWRKLEGLDTKQNQAAVAPGMVGVLRAVGRRQVMEPVEADLVVDDQDPDQLFE